MKRIIELNIGQLVVRRMRWMLDSEHFGLIVGDNGDDDDRKFLVMWVKKTTAVSVNWHLASALLAVDGETTQMVKDRCGIQH